MRDLEQKIRQRELLEGINEEDRKVASAVHACIPQIEKLVNEIVERMHQGDAYSIWEPEPVDA